MAGVSGDAWTLAIGKQSAKGTPQTTPTFKLKVTGGDLMPQRDEIQLAETDSTRQQGKTIVVGSHVEGSPDMYLRPDDFGLLAYGALGANADSGTAPNYIHVASMSASGALPYFTIYKAIGGSVLVDRYSDCRIGGLKIRGNAGQPLSVSADIIGLGALLGQVDPVLTPVTQDPLVYPQVTVTKGGSQPGTIESFEIDINNNLQTIQGDTGLAPYDAVASQLDVSGTMTLLFQDDADYRRFHTGSSSGTVLGTSIFSEQLTIDAIVNANLACKFRFGSVAYTAYPLPPDPGGAPIRVALGWRVQPDASTIANYCEITTRNAIASY